MYIADLHIHSKYSRATSRDCVPEALDLWARRKGIDLVGTGDFTHPAWRAELAEKLIPAEEGFYILKREYRLQEGTAAGESCPRFVITGEISSIYKKNGRVRKIHNLIVLPSLEFAALLSQKLEAIGNLHSDGRPILGLDSHDLLEITLGVCPDAIFIPAHIWTPHFSLFGAFSGFDSIEECYEDLTPHIHALETGLSSDPPMNWRLSALDRFTLVSNSDAHSPSKLGREANLFHTALSYPAMAAALHKGSAGFGGTIEFFPEEGKYHFDGHRNCKLCLTPAQTEEAGGICPVCGGKLTVGVLHRVEQLADRAEGYLPPDAGHFESLVPLPEVIAASTGFSAAGVKVKARYEALLGGIGSEFFILREAPADIIQQVAGPCVAEGIRRVREGRIDVSPGYDGEYGKIKILDEKEIEALSGQICFFGDNPLKKGKKAPSKTRKAAHTAKAASPAANMKMAAVLNAEQTAAVTAQEPAISVVAGPGTGKTSTLVSRIAHLLENGAKASQITAVTFTNQAAQEMRQRLDAHFGNKRKAKNVQIGTFHAICLRLLSAKQAVTVIDAYEARAVMDEVRESLALKPSSRKLLDLVSRFKNGSDLEEPLPDGLLSAYEGRLEAYGVLDYDDLLLRALACFEESAGKKERTPFTHLLVDEFQDINDLQYRLIRAWSRESKSVFIIGDPDQSIYGFRGASPDCFGRFSADYGAHTVRLIRNYRSTPQILGCALPFISHNSGGDRSLEAAAEPGAPVRLLENADDFSEAVFIAKEINRMVGGIDMLGAQEAVSHKERGFSDFAVLYRTHRQALVLEKCLAIEGIPYIVAGRDDLLEDATVRGTVAFFRWLLNPADKIAQHICQPLLSVEQLALESAYAARAAAEKPAKLLESWIADTGMNGAPMEHLLHMAVFHDSMAGFLQNLALGQERDLTRSGGKAYTTEAVHLMTLHAAKGLEYPVVFLCGLKHGILPLDAPSRAADMEEERRLFYVGMTRAQEELVLLSAPDPSPFLQEIPPSAFQSERTAQRKRDPDAKQLSLF